MWRADGWDSTFKLGLLVPHADVGPEAETQAMLTGRSATVHGARVDFSPMHPGGGIDDKIAHDPVQRFVHPDVIDPIVKSLSSAPLDAIGLAFTSSSFMLGAADESRLLDRLTDVSHGTRLVTPGTAAVAAIEHLKLDRIAVMAPSWFDDDLCRAGLSYFHEHGVDVISVTASGPVGGPLTITPSRMAQAVTLLAESTGAGAVLVAGNGQRAVGAIDHVERELGITMLTANQVLLWSCLEDTDIRGEVIGYGRLFPGS
jgi:maleate isomerase